MKYLSILVPLFLVACSKPVPPVQSQTTPDTSTVPPVQAAATATPAVEVPAPVVPVLTSITKVKKHRVGNGLEKAAYAKAYRNAGIANSLLGEHKYRTSRTDKV